MRRAACIVKARNVAGPVNVELEPVGAINDVLQNQIVNRGVGVFVFRADIKQVTARNAVRAIVEDVKAVAAPYQN
ncbi:hypothetical protein D3C80_2020010 [compost metagenome]